VFYFLLLSSFKFNTDVGFSRLLQILNLYEGTLVVDHQFKQFDYTPRVELLLTGLFLVHPNIKLLLNCLPPGLGDQSKDFCLCDAFDGFDGVYELQDKGATTLEHADINVLSASRMKFGLYLIFKFVGIK
jgi:hypothetical protein